MLGKKNSKFDGNFRKIGYLDTSNIKRIFLLNKNKFSISNTNISNNKENIIRQAKVHNPTKHLNLLYEDDLISPNKINAQNKDVLQELNNDLNNIISIVHNFYKNENLIIGRCLYTILPAGKKINDHVDRDHTILIHGHRLHIPIITNELVKFMVNYEYKYLEKGYIYEINNALVHGVENNSNEDRIHLIIDFIDSNILNDNSLHNENM